MMPDQNLVNHPKSSRHELCSPRSTTWRPIFLVQLVFGQLDLWWIYIYIYIHMCIYMYELWWHAARTQGPSGSCVLADGERVTWEPDPTSCSLEIRCASNHMFIACGSLIAMLEWFHPPAASSTICFFQVLRLQSMVQWMCFFFFFSWLNCGFTGVNIGFTWLCLIAISYIKRMANR